MTARRRRWKRFGTFVAVAFLLLVLVLLVRYARALDWHEVAAALAAYELPRLAMATAAVVVCYLFYCSYDLVARAYSGHQLPTRRVALIAFISYAFNLNLGALIGGAGFRFRLYSHSGLGAGTITRIFGFSVITNWLGYGVLGGALFVFGYIVLPPGWELDAAGLRGIGIALWLVIAGYLVCCAWMPGRIWSFRGHHLRLPSLRLAGLQVLLSVLNWLTIAVVLDVLLPASIPYSDVLSVLLLASIAAAAVHIPAGLGVLEATFIALLGHQAAPAELLAALLAYRALYYLAPLLLGIALYLHFEARGKTAAPAAASGPHSPKG